MAGDTAQDTPINTELLEILRCPVAVHYTDKGEDPGKLELVHGCWLVCEDKTVQSPVVGT